MLKPHVRSVNVVLASLFACFVFIAMPQSMQAAVKLVYGTGVPVHHTSTLSVEINESLPLLNLASKGQQTIKFDLTAGQGLGSVTTLPLPLLIVMKDLVIDVDINQMHLTFDPRKPNGTPRLSQLSRLIDRPFHFSVSAQGCIEDSSQEIENLLKEFPALRFFPFDAFLNDLLRHVFALAGKNLQIGAVFDHTSPCNPKSLFPSQISYKITSINDKEIVALINASLPSKELELKTKADSQENSDLRMTLSGTLQGEIAWQRSNAMLYRLNTDYTCTAKLKMGQMEWSIGLRIHHNVTSNAS